MQPRRHPVGDAAKRGPEGGSVLSAALGVGSSFVDAARLAIVAGGIVVQKPGTATCSRAELLSALRPRRARGGA